VWDADLSAGALYPLAGRCQAEGRSEAAEVLYGMVLLRPDGRELHATSARQAAAACLDAGRAREAGAFLHTAARVDGAGAKMRDGAARKQAADRLRSRRLERQAGEFTALCAGWSAFEEIPAVAACVAWAAGEVGHRVLHLTPVAADPGAAHPGSALSQRVREAGSVAESRMMTELHKAKAVVRTFESFAVAEQRALARDDTARWFLRGTAGRQTRTETLLRLDRWRADAVFHAVRGDARQADRDEILRVAKRAGVSGWNEHDRTMFFLFALPTFLLAEAVIVYGLFQLVPMPDWGHKAILALAIPFNIALYRWYRYLVTRPGAILDRVLQGRQESALDGMSQARAHEMKGAYAEAAEEYRKILATSSSRQDARMALAALYRHRMNEPEKAVTEYLAASKIPGDPGMSATALLEAATLLKQAGNAEGAARLLEELLSRFPGEKTAVGARRLLALVRAG